MNPITEPTYHDSGGIAVTRASRFYKRVSWGAVFAGVITSVIIQLLLTLLGVAIGAATIDPLREQNPGEGLGIGAGIWFLVSSLISMYVGGRVAGGFAGPATRNERGLHGMFTWATTSILSVVLLASAAGSLLGGAASMLGNAAGGASQNPSAQSKMQQTIQQAQNVQNDPNASAAVEQKAREVGDKAAKGVSQSAMLTFFALLLGGVAAMLGGRSSAPRVVEENVEEHAPSGRIQPAFVKP